MIMAVIFIQLVAGELVSALNAFGALSGCPEALLGVVVSFGNSMGDLATNLGVAKSTFVRNGETLTGERIAVSACMNGQSFNMLLAPSIGLLWRLHEVPGLHVVPLNLSWTVWFMLDALTAYVAVMVGTSLVFSNVLPRWFYLVAFGAFGVMTSVLVGGFAPVWVKAASS